MNYTTQGMTHSIDCIYTHDERKVKTKMKKVKENNFKDKHYVCNICEKIFNRKDSLIVHLNAHNLDNITTAAEDEQQKNDKSRPSTCSICYKRFTAKKNLLKHLREVHKNYKEAEKMMVKKIKCPERNCDYVCRMMKELRDHIEKSHNVRILKDLLQFPNESVFQKWKKEEESNTVSWFVTGRKKTTLTDGAKKQTLCCHRTGHYNPKGFGKYRMRSVGSCKIGVTCPAAMEVTEHLNGQFTVIYYKTHLGHSQDVVYLKLSREERAELAEKIEQGFSFDAILEDLKESSESKSNITKRIHLLSKKDLYSIMRTASASGKKLKKGTEEQNKNEESIQSKVETTQDLILESLDMEKLRGGDIRPNLTLYPAQDVVISQELATPLRLQREFSKIPQSTGEGVASQIVIFSPENEYTSVAEIILLASNEAGVQTVVSPRKLLKIEDPPHKKPEEVLIPEDRQKPSLGLKIKEKLERIAELLPLSDCLTPKQFDLINAKLDGILDVFNLVKVKAKARRRQQKRRVARPSAKSWEGINETKGSTQLPNSNLSQPIYESPLVYAVYN